MSNSKISALTGATTPLAGTEVLPIVQSSTTKQVSVANLTAGRAISATSVTASTGNFVVGTSGQGIDFSATPGTGTSELLADYEEGTWTPVGNIITLAAASGFYTKIGRAVTFSATVTFPATVDGNLAFFTGLPFTVNASAASSGNGTIGSSTYMLPMTGRVLEGFDRWYNFAVGGALLTNANLSATSIQFGGTYIV
jgi:hypothetical protein